MYIFICMIRAYIPRSRIPADTDLESVPPPIYRNAGESKNIEPERLFYSVHNNIYNNVRRPNASPFVLYIIYIIYKYIISNQFFDFRRPDKQQCNTHSTGNDSTII